MTSEKVQVALAFCDPRGTYARHAAVTMASIFANTESQVCVNILHDNTLKPDNREKLKITAKCFDQEICFINVENMIDKSLIDAKKLIIDGFHLGAMFRLLIPDFIEVDKIIYLDCDIVVNLNIAELWQVSLKDNAIAAVLDASSQGFLKGHKIPWRVAMLWDVMGIAHDSYFNSGVLVMNLKKIREEYDFLEEVGHFYAQFKKCITFRDQDCFNYIFSKDRLLVEPKFNRLNIDKVNSCNVHGSIWHMAGEIKPWNSYTRKGVDELYWHYLTQTPFCEDNDTLIRTMLYDLSSSPYSHLHSSDCIKRLKKQLSDNIFRGHMLTVPYITAKVLKNVIANRMRRSRDQ